MYSELQVCTVGHQRRNDTKLDDAVKNVKSEYYLGREIEHRPTMGATDKSDLK